MVRPRAALLLMFALGVFADTYTPDDVKVLGALDYGQSSDAVEYSGTPKYDAFVFNGNGGDKIDVTVKSPDRTAYVAVADGTLKELASGSNHLTFTLPNRGPDLEAYYIVFRDSESKPGRFTVELKKGS